MTSKYRSRPRDEAAEQIECYIIEKGIRAHQKLPSERTMCEMWGFNRSTLRSAIHRLRVEGVVYNKMGSGTFVAPPKLVRNLQDAQGFGGVARNAGRAPTTQLVRCCVREASKQIAQKLQLPLGHKVMELVRVRALEGVPVLLETAYVDARRCKGIELCDFSDDSTSLYDVLEQGHGLEIVRGVEKLNVTYTDAEEAALLQLAEGSPVIYQTGVVWDAQQIPVEYFKAISRSEYIRFASVLRADEQAVRSV